MRAAVVLISAALSIASFEAFAQSRPRQQPDMGMANTTPQTNRGRHLPPGTNSAVRVGAGRAVQEVLPYGRTRALTGILKPSPYGAAAYELLKPATACAPAREADCRRR